jgi:hypothetical protein
LPAPYDTVSPFAAFAITLMMPLSFIFDDIAYAFDDTLPLFHFEPLMPYFRCHFRL